MEKREIKEGVKRGQKRQKEIKKSEKNEKKAHDDSMKYIIKNGRPGNYGSKATRAKYTEEEYKKKLENY